MNENENMETVLNEPSEPTQETQTEENMDSDQLTENGEIIPFEQGVEQVEILRNYSEIETDNGSILIIHEIGIGEIVISVLLAAILIFMILDKLIRR